MGLRNREPEPLRDGGQSAGSSNRHRRVLIDGGLGIQARIPTATGSGIVWVGIFALPRAYRKRHSWSVVRLLRDLIGHDFVANISGVRLGAVTVAAAPVS